MKKTIQNQTDIMSLSRRLPAHGDDLDNYGLDDDLDNPFASPTPPPESSSKKRKEPDSGLGIEEEVSVQKRVRVPNVKLDEERYIIKNCFLYKKMAIMLNHQFIDY